MLDPEVEAIQRKLLEADEDLSELMNEIMTEMVLVETPAKAKADKTKRNPADGRPPQPKNLVSVPRKNSRLRKRDRRRQPGRVISKASWMPAGHES